MEPNRNKTLTILAPDEHDEMRGELVPKWLERLAHLFQINRARSAGVKVIKFVLPVHEVFPEAQELRCTKSLRCDGSMNGPYLFDGDGAAVVGILDRHQFVLWNERKKDSTRRLS
jgi:hypothetical protein